MQPSKYHNRKQEALWNGVMNYFLHSYVYGYEKKKNAGVIICLDNVIFITHEILCALASS